MDAAIVHDTPVKQPLGQHATACGWFVLEQNIVKLGYAHCALKAKVASVDLITKSSKLILCSAVFF